MYMGIIQITPKILDLLISGQKESGSERILIVSVIDGRMILTERINSLKETSFIYPYRCAPKYENLKYVGIVDENGVPLSERELKLLSGGKNPKHIENVLSKYWDVMLVRDEKEVDVKHVIRPSKKILDAILSNEGDIRVGHLNA